MVITTMRVSSRATRTTAVQALFHTKRLFVVHVEGELTQGVGGVLAHVPWLDLLCIAWPRLCGPPLSHGCGLMRLAVLKV